MSEFLASLWQNYGWIVITVVMCLLFLVIFALIINAITNRYDGSRIGIDPDSFQQDLDEMFGQDESKDDRRYKEYWEDQEKKERELQNLIDPRI